MTEPIHIISLGAGVQSSTMALMAAAGEITPMPAAAIFADTQAEPKQVYTWLDWLEKQLPFPVHRVTRGNLMELSSVSVQSKAGKWRTNSSPPAFTFDQAGNPTGLAMRQCTQDFKLKPIFKKMRELRGKKHVIQWIGISTDEIYRMKPSREKWLTNSWPLIEHRMSRRDCLNWMKRNGYEEPPRSACSFCPYHSDKEWARLKRQEPEAFSQAVEYEIRLQAAVKKGSGFHGNLFLHRSGKPISEVDFSTEEERGQLNMFNNECEGMCGV
jgi:hypothetical protein